MQGYSPKADEDVLFQEICFDVALTLRERMNKMSKEEVCVLLPHPFGPPLRPAATRVMSRELGLTAL